MERRQLKLVNQSVRLPLDDLKWIQTQGFRSFDEIPKMSRWYHPDGSSSVGHSNAYHIRLYRQRGFTLKPPVQVVEPKRYHYVKQKPLIVTQLLRIMEGLDTWEGTATEVCNLLESRTPDSIGKLLFSPKVLSALASEGLSIERGWKNRNRVLRLKRCHDS